MNGIHELMTRIWQWGCAIVRRRRIAREQRAALHDLLALDAHTLRDIGLSRAALLRVHRDAERNSDGQITGEECGAPQAVRRTTVASGCCSGRPSARTV